MTHLTPDLLEFIRLWLPSPPARVLEIGCGDGALTERLAGLGYRATGIDPHPPAGGSFVATTLEEFDSNAGFDAAVAIRSLHHLDDLERAVGRVAAALPRGGRLLVFEYAVENVDRAALRWQAENGLEGMHGGEDVIPLGELRRALSARFRELAFEPATYLARGIGREDLHRREAAAIEAGELSATGARLALERI